MARISIASGFEGDIDGFYWAIFCGIMIYIAILHVVGLSALAYVAFNRFRSGRLERLRNLANAVHDPRGGQTIWTT